MPRSEALEASGWVCLRRPTPKEKKLLQRPTSLEIADLSGLEEFVGERPDRVRRPYNDSKGFEWNG